MMTAAATESRDRTADGPAVRTYTYYPGCTLYTKAKTLDRCARLAAQKVGFELQEMPSWVCCGAIYNASEDDFAGRIGAQRNLVRASALGDRLVTLCAACYIVLKRAQARLNDPANAVERQRVHRPRGGADAEIWSLAKRSAQSLTSLSPSLLSASRISSTHGAH